MKKTSKILTIGLLGALFMSCTHNETNSSSENKGERNIGKLSIEETMDKVVIENSDLKLTFDKLDGRLLSFVNTVSQNDFIKDSVGGNWAMLINTKTNDVFEAKPSDSENILVTSRNKEATFKKDVSLDRISISFEYSIYLTEGNTDSNFISVVNTIEMIKDNQEISFSYSVENKLNQGVIISFSGAQLTGLKSNNKKWNLFWPSYEGKIYYDAIESSKNGNLAKLEMVYPVPSSVQLMQLFDTNQSLYYYVKDTTREYKTLNFGPFISTKEYDNGAVETNDKVSMSITQYPYISKNEKKDIAETIIGVSQNGDYYQGSFSYVSFLKQSGMTKNKTSFSKEFTGYTPLIMDMESAKDFSSYVTPTKDLTKTTIGDYIDKFNASGIKTVNLLGWHVGGFDHMYPDYKFKEEVDGNGYGEDNFLTAMDSLHDNGQSAVAYINMHIADVESEWSNTIYDEATGRTNIQRAAIKNKRYSSLTSESLAENKYVNTMIQENYGTTTYYYAMCPSSKLFQNAILSAVRRLRENDIDGIWFDQLMQMPANLCFDPTHGHKTPATAYGEGYSYLLSEINKVMEEISDRPYFHSAEGVCDAYVQWVDACGYLWSRPFGALDTSDATNYVPEITRASIPAIFLGQDGAGSYSGDDDEFAKAFLMFDPLLVSNELEKVYQYTSLYMNDSTYLNGNYIGSCGISSTNSDVLVGASYSQDKKKLIINIYNFSNNQASSDISLDLSRIGLEGNIKSMSVALGDEEQFAYSNRTITVKNLTARQVCSIKLTIGD